MLQSGDLRNTIPNNSVIEIKGTRYIVNSVKGTGASSIVYDVIRCDDGKSFILKEFYPLNAYARREDDNLLTFAYKEDDKFSLMRERFLQAYEKLKAFKIDRNTTNFVVDTLEDPFLSESRGYAYYIEGFDNGAALNLEEVCLPEFIDVLIKTVNALEAIHRFRNSLYIDLKPGNIFYAPDAGYIKLFDVDNSLVMSENPDYEAIKNIGTTMEYAAPELIEAMEGSQRYMARINETTDFFGIGVILLNYFLGMNDIEKLRAGGFKRDDIGSALLAFNKLTEYDPALIRNISDFCAKILSRRQKFRYSNGKEICEKLSEIKLFTESEVYFKSSNFTSGDLFVGRKEQLTKITDILDEEQIVCIYAEAGMGKSSLARKYAEDERSNYDAVFTVSYAEHPSISKMMEYVYDKYVVKRGRSRDDNYYDKVRLLKNYFQTARGLLIVDDFDYIKGELPIDELKDIEWKIILTSRSNYVHDFGKTLNLEPISDQRELFIGYYNLLANRNNNAEYNHESDTYLDELIKYLEGNTLAIELVARNAAINRIAIDSLLRSFEREINNEDSIHDVNPIRDDHRINDNSYFVIRRVFNLFKEVDGRKILKEEELFFIYLFALINIPRPEEYILYKLQLSDEKKSDFTGIYERLWTAGWIKKRSYNKGSSANPVEGTEYYLRRIIREVVLDKDKDFYCANRKEYSNYIENYFHNSMYEVFSLSTTTQSYFWPDIQFLSEYLSFLKYIEGDTEIADESWSKLCTYCKANVEIMQELRLLENRVTDLYKEYYEQNRKIDFNPNEMHDFSNLRTLLKKYDDIVEIYRLNRNDYKFILNKALWINRKDNELFWNCSEEEQNQYLSGMWNIKTYECKVCDKSGNRETQRIIYVPSFWVKYVPPLVKWNDYGRITYESIKQNAFSNDLQLALCGYGQYQYMVGLRYLEGKGCENNISEAVKWFVESSEKIGEGNLQDFAAYELGELFSKGDVLNNVEKDINKAIYYYRKANGYNHSEEKADKLERVLCFNANYELNGTTLPEDDKKYVDELMNYVPHNGSVIAVIARTASKKGISLEILTERIKKGLDIYVDKYEGYNSTENEDYEKSCIILNILIGYLDEIQLAVLYLMPICNSNSNISDDRLAKRLAYLLDAEDLLPSLIEVVESLYNCGWLEKYRSFIEVSYYLEDIIETFVSNAGNYEKAISLYKNKLIENDDKLVLTNKMMVCFKTNYELAGVPFPDSDSKYINELMNYVPHKESIIAIIARTASRKKISLETLTKQIKKGIDNYSEENDHSLEIDSDKRICIILDIMYRYLDDIQRFTLNWMSICNSHVSQKRLVNLLGAPDNEASGLIAVVKSLYYFGWLVKKLEKEDNRYEVMFYMKDYIETFVYQEAGGEKTIGLVDKGNIFVTSYIRNNMIDFFTKLEKPINISSWNMDDGGSECYFRFFNRIGEHFYRSNKIKEVINYCKCRIAIEEEIKNLTINLYNVYKRTYWKKFSEIKVEDLDFSALIEILKQYDDILCIANLCKNSVNKNNINSAENNDWFWSSSSKDKSKFLASIWKIDSAGEKIILSTGGGLLSGPSNRHIEIVHRIEKGRIGEKFVQYEGIKIPKIDVNIDSLFKELSFDINLLMNDINHMRYTIYYFDLNTIEESDDNLKDSEETQD